MLSLFQKGRNAHSRVGVRRSKVESGALMMCAQAKLGRRESYRSTMETTRVGLILTLAWLLIISEAQQLFRRAQNLFCLPNAWLDLQEGHQVFDRLVEHFEGH